MISVKTFIFFTVIVMSSTMDLAEAAKKCRDCTDTVRKLLNEPYLGQKVFQILKQMEDPQAECRLQDSFSYFDFTAGRCHKCKDICNDTGSTIECVKVCQPYLLSLNNNVELNELKEDLKNKEDAISQLRFQNLIAYLLLGFLFITEVVLHILQFLYNKRSDQTSRIASPISDTKEDKTPRRKSYTVQQETNRNDLESAYVSSFTVNSEES